MSVSTPIQSATIARVATSGTVATLLAASGARNAVIIVNESAAVMYVKYGSAATATSYTYAIVAGGTLEAAQPVYGGIITGILASGTGNAQVTSY